MDNNNRNDDNNDVDDSSKINIEDNNCKNVDADEETEGDDEDDISGSDINKIVNEIHDDNHISNLNVLDNISSI